jgi:molybdate transport system substrate-binding protein
VGLVDGVPRPYAIGRIALWSRKGSGVDISKGMKVLLDPRVRTIAIANPDHAPYGRRSKEALLQSGLWEKVTRKIVTGENISQAAQFAQIGNADVGIVSLSLALSPPMMKDGRYILIDAASHKPLEQSFVILKSAAAKPGVHGFATFMGSREAREILKKYGFTVPAT